MSTHAFQIFETEDSEGKHFEPIGRSRTWMFLATSNVTSLVATEGRMPRSNTMDGPALREVRLAITSLIL